jgi:hypothetical protein
MDATAVLTTCSWVLAEIVRYSQKGLDISQAKAVVDGVMRRKYPFIEEIDGRVYVDIANSAREAALLILWHKYPKRVSGADLTDMVLRHGYKRPNAARAVARVCDVVDDEDGRLRLRNTGVRQAEELIERAEKARRG